VNQVVTQMDRVTQQNAALVEQAAAAAESRVNARLGLRYCIRHDVGFAQAREDVASVGFQERWLIGTRRVKNQVVETKIDISPGEIDVILGVR
jgi:hypothetical protein